MEFKDLIEKLEIVSDDEEIFMDMMMECLTADDQKINSVGNALSVFMNMKNFTPYEACALAGTVIISSCVVRAKEKDVESTKIFGDHVVKTIKEGLNECLGELEEGKSDESCKDGDKSCKCE